MNAREVAYRILFDFHTKRAELDTIIERVFNKTKIDSRDKRLAFSISYGVLRNQSYLNYVGDKFIDKKLSKEVSLRIAVNIALFQMIFLDKIPAHAAVNESVNLMKKDKNTRRLSGAVNGILRNFMKNKKSALKIDTDSEGNPLSNIDKLSIEYSHPQWIIEKWIAEFGTAKTKKLLKINNEKAPNYVRWNSANGSHNQFESDIASICYKAPQGIGYKKSYYQLKDGVIPSEIDSFIAGRCTVQSPSSGWPVALLGCERGDFVLDVSSAPGGKTTHIAELVGKDGIVIANDSSPKRILKVVENSFRLKLNDRIYPIVSNGTDTAYNVKFDKILLDAPCTGTGVFRRNPDSRWIRKEDDITRAVKLQKELLDRTAELVKDGGVMVYSTCSLEKEENWDQVESFLKRHPEFTLEDASEYVDRKFVSIDKCLFITPQDHSLDGMFAARLVKNG